MTITFVDNGETQLVLTPTSEKEKFLLSDFEGKTVKIEKLQTTQILGKNHVGALVISVTKVEATVELNLKQRDLTQS